MGTDSTDKDTANGIAQAALAGLTAVASRDERGQRTLILTRGVWTCEVPLEGLAQALEQAKALAG